jgi:hypothetical protein
MTAAPAAGSGVADGATGVAVPVSGGVAEPADGDADVVPFPPAPSEHPDTVTRTSSKTAGSQRGRVTRLPYRQR